MRLAIIYRVVQHWRKPVFDRIGRVDGVELKVFHGESIPGTKLQTARDLPSDTFLQLRTWFLKIIIGGRVGIILLQPMLGFRLVEFKPDVIVVEGGSNWLNNIFVYIYASIFNVPVVWWSLGEIPGRRYTAIGKIYRAFVQLMERRAIAIIGYSSVAESYYMRLGVPKHRIFVALNCVDEGLVRFGQSLGKVVADKLRADLFLADCVVGLYVGALVREKNVDRLLRSIAIVAPSQPNLCFVFVGDGPDRSRLEGLSKALGVESRVRWIGEIVDGVSVFFELADFLVLPGLGGLVISEAMLHRLPVVCVRGDGSEVDLVIDGETGFRIDDAVEENVLLDEIAQRILWLCRFPAQRAAMGLEAEKRFYAVAGAGRYVQRIIGATTYAWSISVYEKTAKIV